MIKKTEEIPRVLILLATFNGEKFIARQLDSIFNQIDVDISVDVSDDCSTDNTLDILTDYANRGFKINIINSNQRFGSASKNFFNLILNSDLSNFDYVSFSDQDDIWFKDKIKHSIEKLNEFKVNGFSSNVIALWANNGKEKLIKKSYSHTGLDHWFESPGPGCSQTFTQHSFYRFKIFLKKNITKLDKIDYHDWLIYAYYQHNYLGWHISSTSTMYYLQHESNQIGANYGLTALANRLRQASNGWYEDQINLIFSIVANQNRDLLSLKFLLSNFLKIRRKKVDSVFLSIFLSLKVIIRSISLSKSS